jgi:7-carboxy-7-deazaguanine synthase
MTDFKVSEIFYSLQGESLSVGCPTVFIRLTGCPLRCSYCDTEYAFSGGEELGLDEILQQVAAFNAPYVNVTGGEPLWQEGCRELLTALCSAGYKVSLETSGSLDISNIDPGVVIVMDLKTPGSGEAEKNHLENIEKLRSTDQIKFVICNQEDYLWSRDMVQRLALAERCEVLFLPAYEKQEAAELAEWILQDHLPVRFQLQLHKQIWGDVAGR